MRISRMWDSKAMAHRAASHCPDVSSVDTPVSLAIDQWHALTDRAAYSHSVQSSRRVAPHPAGPNPCQPLAEYDPEHLTWWWCHQCRKWQPYRCASSGTSSTCSVWCPGTRSSHWTRSRSCPPWGSVFSKRNKRRKKVNPLIKRNLIFDLQWPLSWGATISCSALCARHSCWSPWSAPRDCLPMLKCSRHWHSSRFCSAYDRWCPVNLVVMFVCWLQPDHHLQLHEKISNGNAIKRRLQPTLLVLSQLCILMIDCHIAGLIRRCILRSTPAPPRSFRLTCIVSLVSQFRLVIANNALIRRY